MEQRHANNEGREGVNVGEKGGKGGKEEIGGKKGKGEKEEEEVDVADEDGDVISVEEPSERAQQAREARRLQSYGRLELTWRDILRTYRKAKREVDSEGVWPADLRSLSADVAEKDREERFRRILSQVTPHVQLQIYETNPIPQSVQVNAVLKPTSTNGHESKVFEERRKLSRDTDERVETLHQTSLPKRVPFVLRVASVQLADRKDICSLKGPPKDAPRIEAGFAVKAQAEVDRQMDLSRGNMMRRPTSIGWMAVTGKLLGEQGSGHARTDVEAADHEAPDDKAQQNGPQVKEDCTGLKLLARVSCPICENPLANESNNALALVSSASSGSTSRVPRVAKCGHVLCAFCAAEIQGRYKCRICGKLSTKLFPLYF